MFNDESNQTIEYTYDQNGNMITDANKGISNISYNELNLPEEISFTNGKALHYYYAANGTKLKEVLTDGAITVSTREYVGGMLYIDGVMQFMQTETGRVLKSGSTYTYIHSIADHQGNIRVNFQNNNGTAELIQEDHYYPFGLTMGQSYVSGPENYNLYSSKEWKDQSGEQWYDFGFRNYDAALGRWFNPDAFAESYGAISPYNYCLNDPINYIDPFGLFPEYKPYIGWVDNEDNDRRMSEQEVRSWFMFDSEIYYTSDEIDMILAGKMGYEIIETVYDFIYDPSRSWTIWTGSASNPYMHVSYEAAFNIISEEVTHTFSAWNNNASSGGGLTGSEQIALGYRNYGGDYSGSFSDWVYYIADQLNQFNPIAIGWDYLTYLGNGTDRFGNPMSPLQANLSAAAALMPILKVGKISVAFNGVTGHGVNRAISRGFTSPNILRIMREGTAVEAMGRYGPQIRYSLGGNTVVVAGSGRNAGKIITTYSTAADKMFIPFK